jgi:hypothetical protein
MASGFLLSWKKKATVWEVLAWAQVLVRLTAILSAWLERKESVLSKEGRRGKGGKAERRYKEGKIDGTEAKN